MLGRVEHVFLLMKDWSRRADRPPLGMDGQELPVLHVVVWSAPASPPATKQVIRTSGSLVRWPFKDSLERHVGMTPLSSSCLLRA